jgi:hypothetical protein
MKRKLIFVAAVVVVIVGAGLITVMLESWSQKRFGPEDKVVIQWKAQAPLEPEPRSRPKVIYHETTPKKSSTDEVGK